LQTRYIELTSFAELALARHHAGPSQPAFETMSVETECLDGRVLLARRRTQSPGEPQVWAARLIVGETGPIQFETDRREFLGGGNSATLPDALKRDLAGSAGVILDPVFSLRCRPALEARARQIFTFVTLAAPTRDALLSLVDKYRRVESVARTFEMAWTRGQLEFRYLGISPAAAGQFEELAGHLLYRKSRPHLSASGPAINKTLPILTVLAADHLALPLIREVLLAHTYWHLRGLSVDLVIVNQPGRVSEPALHQQLERLIEAHSLHTGTNQPGGIFLKDCSIGGDPSNIVLYGSRGSLQKQLKTLAELAILPVIPPETAARPEIVSSAVYAPANRGSNSPLNFV
jgi:cyclic beta-1,2-glucan synthetase